MRSCQAPRHDVPPSSSEAGTIVLKPAQAEFSAPGEDGERVQHEESTRTLDESLEASLEEDRKPQESQDNKPSTQDN